MRNDLEMIKTEPRIKKHLKAKKEGYQSLYENYDTEAENENDKLMPKREVSDVPGEVSGKYEEIEVPHQKQDFRDYDGI